MTKKFSHDERACLLAVKGVGPKVIERFEQMGISSLAHLSRQAPQDITGMAAMLTGSTCWKNSPQAIAAVTAAIEAAKKSGHKGM